MLSLSPLAPGGFFVPPNQPIQVAAVRVHTQVVTCSLAKQRRTGQ